ncbi:hypothetical protein [Cupriavidus sp. CuC1]|uniref:hypothetical protein n=1 Tax=Cupriavidus sp. CuC1 TaxID=3373131 RepID=UPI0037D3BDBA
MLPAKIIERARKGAPEMPEKPRSVSLTLPAGADAVHIHCTVNLKKLAEMRRGLPRPRVARSGEVGIMESVRRMRDGEE